MRWLISDLRDSICAWNSVTAALDVPLGMSRDEAERRALAIVETFARRGSALPPLVFTEDLPDVLHALCQALARNESGLAENGDTLTGLHELVASLTWPHDEFDEKAELLARISHLAWSRSLGRGDALETLRWEEESVGHLLGQETGQQLVNVPASNWSPMVCERFLSDRALLLGLCTWLRSEVNFSPRPVLELASLVYGWLSTHAGAPAVRKEEAYLLTDLASSAANCARVCGRYASSQAWLVLAEKWCGASKDPLVSGARVEYARLALLHETRQYSAVLSRVSELVDRFAQLGLQDNVVKSKFLRAQAQKELDRDDEALESLSVLEVDSDVIRQPWLHGLVLVSIAELQSRARRPDTALRFVLKADMLLRDVRMPFGLAHCCAITAEILRDQGKLSAAVECYRRAVEIYVAADMTVFAAYLRIVLAETLVATGKDEEGVEEILAALPTIERESLVQEAIAAVGLLKVSLSRRKLNLEALKALRESFDRSRRGLES